MPIQLTSANVRPASRQVSSLRNTDQGGGNAIFILDGNYDYCDSETENATGKTINVPSGYVTDFSSIPPFARFLFNPQARFTSAAIIHDWMYAIGTKGDEAARKEADDIFRRALDEEGRVSPFAT